MNDIVTKTMLFEGRAIVSVISSTNLVNSAIAYHKLSNTAAAALGRVLTVAAFFSSGFKSKNNKLTISIDGGGPLGKIIALGDYGCKVRGYVEHGSVELALNDLGKLSVGEGVGKDGFLTVIKDFNLKEPYVGQTQLVSGEIAEDFAYYFNSSEQIPTAIALGVSMKNGKCQSAGGIVIQPMPNCKEEELVMIEDSINFFTNISKLLMEKTPQEIIDFYFEAFGPINLTPSYPEYFCNCSLDRVKEVVRALGRKEAESIIKEQGCVEAHCKFCNKYHKVFKEDLDEIFKK